MISRQATAESHPSINASMDDFEAREFSPTMPNLPSQHSGFRSHNTSDYSERSSRRSFSPPTWRKAGSGWFNHPPALSPGRGKVESKEPSPQYHSVNSQGYGDVAAWRSAVRESPSRVELPPSPKGGRSRRSSPAPEAATGPYEDDKGGGDRTLMGGPLDNEDDSADAQTPTQNNYIRFTGSVAVQHRTDAIEDAVGYVRKGVRHVTRSKYNAMFYITLSLFVYWLGAGLLSPPAYGPVPDIVRVAGLAKSFEPIIYYSEAGHQQIGELQDTGVAVWDLSESLRNTNMTSAPMIVKQLESLSESLGELSTEMTRFFVGLDGDVDAILLAMEWAGRELSRVSQVPQNTLSAVYSNAHNLLTRSGIVSADSHILKDLVGQTVQQRTRAALERAFNEVLNVLEESINNELQVSVQLFSLFEAIDKQFLNLHRSVIREQDTQERIESDFLSSMWTRVVGVNASKLRKYEKNKDLLQTVRDRTVRNKHVLVDHNQRLLQMKSALEGLRQRLVSPLLRRMNSSTLSIEEQILGLESTYTQLRSVREAQKSKKMAMIFGARERRDDLQIGVGMRARGVEIEGRSR